MAASKDAQAEGGKPAKKDDDKKKTFTAKEEELSDEDLKLKESLEAQVLRLQDPKGVAAAIETIGKEIRTSTTSMTSVPKPLKFLRPHYEAIKAAFEGTPKESKAVFADVLSVLATVSGNQDDREALRYRLQGTGCDPASWGHEYMRHIAGEIAAEYHQRALDTQPVDELMELVKVLVPHYMKHNSETEAVDLLLEVDEIGMLLEHIDDKNYQRSCLYLTSAAAFLPEPDDTAVLRTAFAAYMKVEKWHDAIRVALRMNDQDSIQQVFATCSDPIDKQQLGYLLARHGTVLDCEDGPCSIADEELREKVVEIMSNSKLSEKFLTLARDLDVMEPKLPEDIYKMHLVDQRPGALGNMDSAMKNLSNTLVNALLNVGFGVDKLVTPVPEGMEKHWIFRNKDQGKICATASLGAINMWDVDAGMPQLDKYTYSEDPHVVAGACLGFGLCCCCVRSELDPAFALLYEHVSSKEPWVRIGAVMGLGLAYAGTCKADVQGLLIPLITDPDSPMDLVGHAALSLGLVYAATCEQESVEAILQALMMLPEAKLTDPFVKFVLLGLGMLFLGKQETVEPTLEVAKSLNERISKYAAVVLDTCAYAGSGNVLKVQEMLVLCGEHHEDVEEGNEWQTAHMGPATIGIGLIAMGEDLGASMACRVLEHLLQYGDPRVRQAVPLALALLNLSNPDMYTMDTLSRLSHDQDDAVTKSAILAFGFLGAGTNNARLAGMLRNLSVYYAKDPHCLHIVRLAQGMLHLGKGLVTITPFHTDRQLMSLVSLAGILSVLYCGLDMNTTLCGKHAFMLYYLGPAMKPRFLLTIDENGDNVPVAVRVGQAVDTVAQAGQPKGITGFQTHNTPVLLGVRDRAELATDKYIAVSPLLEGVVIVRPNPDYVEGELK